MQEGEGRRVLRFFSPSCSITYCIYSAGEDGSLPTIRDNLGKEEYLEIKENLTSAERTRLMKQLTEHQAYKHRGIRATNKSLAMDAMQTANRIGDVVRSIKKPSL